MCESYQFACKKDMGSRSSGIRGGPHEPQGIGIPGFSLSGAVMGFTGIPTRDSLHVLTPITHGNLTIFPVVGGPDYDTSHIMTLDEGTKAGSVIVTEQGSLRGLVRRPQQASRGSGPQVNQLVLVNDSDRPLLLLAGEIVTGGKQDRVIGVDRIVPPKSDPIDLSVFCVEPGRWAATQRSVRQHAVADGAAQCARARDGCQEPATGVGQGGDSSTTVEVTAAASLVSADNARPITTYSQGMITPNGGNDLSSRAHRTTSYAATMAIPQVQAKIDSVDRKLRRGSATIAQEWCEGRGGCH